MANTQQVSHLFWESCCIKISVFSSSLVIPCSCIFIYCLGIRGGAKDLTGRVHKRFKGKGVIDPTSQKFKIVSHFLHLKAPLRTEKGPLLGQFFIRTGAMHLSLEIDGCKCTLCTRAAVAPGFYHHRTVPRHLRALCYCVSMPFSCECKDEPSAPIAMASTEQSNFRQDIAVHRTSC